MSLESLPQSIRHRLDILSECILVPNATSFQTVPVLQLVFNLPVAKSHSKAVSTVGGQTFSLNVTVSLNSRLMQ